MNYKTVWKNGLAAVLTAAMVLQGGIPAASAGTVMERKPLSRTYASSVMETVLSKATPTDSTPSESTPSGATPSDSERLPEEMMPLDASVGDLWDDWEGDMDFTGYGTEEDPYQINSLSKLMGLSEMAASGTTFEGVYIELTCDIDLGSIGVNDGNWNPIGWYQNHSELGGEVRRAFKGQFDGGGYCISGLKIINVSQPLSNVGLFGLIDGGSVKNLTVESADIMGEDRAAVLAGEIKGDAKIYNVTVSGYVTSKGSAGGIAGEITGGTQYTTVENCLADGIVLNSEGRGSFVGGIAGNVQRADLVDNTVITYDGDANRIRGKGYVGGIAGRMNLTNIYNSYVSGTIGGNGSQAVGGMAGKYESGNLILARFAGDISRTNQGSAAREGSFIGTREARHHFSYGTEKNSNLAYLFTSSEAMTKRILGSSIDGDNVFTKQAHIGYWTDLEKKYVTVAGNTETGSGDRYFYEELEDGIRFIVTKKLGREFTADGYAKGLAFQIDHIAPGYQGEPVRGYLVSVPRIDTKNANGTFDTDVAVLTAAAATNNSWYRQIDKDHPAAIAPGEIVSVATAPRNKGENRYQMVFDDSEPGKVKPPFYSDGEGNQIPMAYNSGGFYTFEMPAWDTELNAEYIKVTTKLSMNPEEMDIQIIHTRSGDRKHPSIITEVKNEDGILAARYINGVADKEVEVQPFLIRAVHNTASADHSVKWSVDDTDLLVNSSAPGYTLEDARIMPNLNSSYIQTIINRAVQNQADQGYRDKINNMIYSQSAVVTAAANPASSADNREVYGNCRINVTFQIIDHTTLRVEDLKLNKSSIAYTVTRKLTGDRKNPSETFQCSEPVVLSAVLNPAKPFFKQVSWSDESEGKSIKLEERGDHAQDCVVTARYDPDGVSNPAWIQNVIYKDNAGKQESGGYGKMSGTASFTDTVTAVSEDQTHGFISADCEVAINFRTVDETVIHPEQVLLDSEKMLYELVCIKTGSSRNPEIQWNGFTPVKLNASVLPELDIKEEFMPYNRNVRWISSNADILSVDQNGNIVPTKDGQWIRQETAKGSHDTMQVVTVKAVAEDNEIAAECQAVIKLKVIDRTYSSGSSFGGGGGGSTGITPEGSQKASSAPLGSVIGTWVQTADGRWSFTSGGRTYGNEWAYIHNPYTIEGQDAADWFRFSESGHMVTGWFTDEKGLTYYLNPISDNTLGRMVTGWHWINGKCYYFNPASDGTRGALVRNTETPDGYRVDEDGAWIAHGAVYTVGMSRAISSHQGFGA